MNPSHGRRPHCQAATSSSVFRYHRQLQELVAQFFTYESHSEYGAVEFAIPAWRPPGGKGAAPES